MSIEAMVTYRCKAKEAIGDELLLRLVKAQNRAAAVTNALTRSGDTRSPAQVPVILQYRQPSGDALQSTSLSALNADAGKLVAYREACLRCPAGELHRPFGCYAAISYPIHIEAEDRLMKLLPSDISKSPMREFIEHWKSCGFTGATSKDMRQHRGQFFEGTSPIIRRWNGGFQIESDQLIGSMFHVGHVSPSHAVNLLYLLGIIDHDSSMAQLQSLFADLDFRREALLGSAMENSARTATVPEFALFLDALRRAAALNVELLIDF